MATENVYSLPYGECAAQNSQLWNKTNSSYVGDQMLAAAVSPFNYTGPQVVPITVDPTSMTASVTANIAA